MERCEAYAHIAGIKKIQSTVNRDFKVYRITVNITKATINEKHFCTGVSTRRARIH